MPMSSRVALAPDVLIGGAGSDTLIGGEGNDTALYEGIQSDYRFGVAQGLLTVTNIATGAMDTLDGIETIEFADGPIGISLDVNGGFILSGSSLEDTITVTSDAGFTLEGGAGADVLEGGAGSDTLIGGEGNDTALYEGIQSDYRFGVDQGLLTVTHITTGAMDTLDGIETIEFADGPIGISLDVNGGFILSGSSLEDTITVTSDAGFTLEGGAGADVLEGGAGSDTLIGGEGSDTLIGGEGNDTALYEGIQSDYRFGVAQGLLTVTHIATGAMDTLDGIETLEFADGPIGVSLDVNGGFILSGSSIQDTITVTSDAGFTLEGGAGADVLEGGAGSDTLIGGEGNDTALYEGIQSDYRFGVAQGLLTVTHIATGAMDTLDGIETLEFADGPIGVSLDVNGGFILSGSSLEDTITVTSDAGFTLEGGAGADVLEAGASSDVLIGGAGSDVLIGGEGNDTALYEGIQSDYRFGVAQGLLTVTNIATGAMDTLDGIETLEFADGPIGVSLDDEGRYALSGTSAADTIRVSSGGAADSQFVNDIEPNSDFASAQIISRSAFQLGPNPDVGDSSLPWVSIDGYAETGADKDFYRFELQAGEKIFLDVDYAMNSGDESVDTYMHLYDANGSQLVGNDDYSHSVGGLGSVHSYDSYIQYTAPAAGVFYGAVRALSSGRTGDYILNVSIEPTENSTGLGVGISGDQSFVLEGGDGTDVLEGGIGSDTLIGGEGNDTALYEGIQSDYRFGVAQGLLTVTHIATGAMDTLDGIETIEFADGPIGISLDVNGGYSLSGSSLEDTITVTSDAGFTLEGGAGADVLEGGAGSDTLIGGEGNDTALYEGIQSDYRFGVDQGLLTVTHITTGAMDTLDGIETIEFADGPIGISLDVNGGFVLSGSSLEDTITVTSDAGFTLEGGAGTDVLEGGAGSDTLIGGEGSDTLIGGEGNDTAIYEGAQSDYRFGVDPGSADGNAHCDRRYGYVGWH